MSDCILEKIRDLDENDGPACAAFVLEVQRGLQRYTDALLEIVNGAKADRPIALAAMKVVYESCRNLDAELADAIDAVHALPIEALTVPIPRKGGRRDG